MSRGQRPPTADRPRIPAVYGVPAGGEGLLPWTYVEGRLSAARVFWLATAGRRGPHVRPIGGLYVDGAIFLSGSPDSRWVRNVDASPEVSVHLDDGFDVVIVEGVVEPRVPDLGLAERLAAAANAKDPERHVEPADYEGRTLRALRPRVAYAWTAFPTDVTRFRFEDAD
jgi:hypothetical protein